MNNSDQISKQNITKKYKKMIKHCKVGLAEWSKALDLSSNTRKCAWVQIPHPTISCNY